MYQELTLKPLLQLTCKVSRDELGENPIPTYTAQFLTLYSFLTYFAIIVLDDFPLREHLGNNFLQFVCRTNEVVAYRKMDRNDFQKLFKCRIAYLKPIIICIGNKVRLKIILLPILYMTMAKSATEV